MKRLISALLTAAASTASSFAASSPSWLPSVVPPPPETGPALTQGGYLKPEQGQAVLEAALKQFPDRASWETYGKHVRQRMQEGLNLVPWPRRTPLNAVIHSKRSYDGYTVESVFFESFPGNIVTGTLYRPTAPQGPMPVVLSTHGHSRRVQTNADYATHARFGAGMQARSASLARMGATVFAIDMLGYGDSIQVYGQDAHRTSPVLTIQTWNSMRALDFLLDLPGVDATRVAVSGESGGGTQSFLLAALDPRVTLSAPVVMVSSYFFGGCHCESGLPIHRSADHFVNNAMIAALFAPKPLLIVSDGKDWTAHNPQYEYPFLQKIYGYYGATDKVANVHLPEEGHDYGPSKRQAFYRFIAEKFALDLSAVQSPDGKLDESRCVAETPAQLHVFTPENPIPPLALHDIASAEKALKVLQQPEQPAPKKK